MPRDESSLGIRSERVYARLGAMAKELARLERELVRNDMNIPGLNLESAQEWLKRAQKNWDHKIKW